MGRTLPGIEIELRDDRGEPVAAGEVGHIIVKSRYLFQAIGAMSVGWMISTIGVPIETPARTWFSK